MTGKDKFLYILLSVITLGIYPIIVRKNSKIETTSSELSKSKKITINIQKLREAIGGETNISGSEYTHTKVKIFVKDRKLAQMDDIKNIKGISGIFAGSNYITVIVGNQAKALSNAI